MPSPPSATGQRSARQPGALAARGAIAAATVGRADRALEGVGGDEDRLRAGTSAIVGHPAPQPACARAQSEAITIEAAGREVRISNPGKVFFPEPGFTKLDLVNYYLECAEAVAAAICASARRR